MGLGFRVSMFLVYACTFSARFRFSSGSKRLKAVRVLEVLCPGPRRVLSGYYIVGFTWLLHGLM